MAFFWNPNNLRHLDDMWSKGLTARQIAEAIGCPSRNAVIAQARRRGLPGRPSPIKTAEQKQAAPRVGSNNPFGRPPKVDPDRIKALLATDLSGAEIAERLGVSASVVSRVKGKYPTLKQGAHRKALCGTARREARRRFEREPFLPFAEGGTAPNIQPRVVPVVPLTLVVSGSGSSDPVPFKDLQSDQCRWMEGPTIRGRADHTLCCGAKQEKGSPYCIRHTVRATVRKIEVAA